MGRPPEEIAPVLSLPPGLAHRTASVTYQKRNVEEGKCSVCPNPLARNSVRYCEKHLAVCRGRARARAKKPAVPATANPIRSYPRNEHEGHGWQAFSNGNVRFTL